MRFVAVVACLLACACPGATEAPGAGEGEGEAPCFIGDPDAPPVITFLTRLDTAGTDVDVVDGLEVPLALHPEGSRIVLIGLRARNISCEVGLGVTAFDSCAEPDAPFGRDTRPVVLVEDDDGFGRPVPADFLANYAQLPLCPAFGNSRDVDGQPALLEMIVTEALREGELEPRVHSFRGVAITPVCAPGDVDCACLCDVDVELAVPVEEQCPSINDNDLAFGACP